MIATLAAASAACVPATATKRAQPSYDDFTGRLVQLSADQNGDGRADQWTYLDGNRPLRGEADANADSRIDRWEYFNADAALVTVGTSSLDDGIEDTWVAVAPNNARRSSAVSRHPCGTGAKDACNMPRS